MNDIDYEQLEQESRLFPWLDDPDQEPEDYECDNEEE